MSCTLVTCPVCAALPDHTRDPEAAERLTDLGRTISLRFPSPRPGPEPRIYTELKRDIARILS